jgi:hypothetical protein
MALVVCVALTLGASVALLWAGLAHVTCLQLEAAVAPHTYTTWQAPALQVASLAYSCS